MRKSRETHLAKQADDFALLWRDERNKHEAMRSALQDLILACRKYKEADDLSVFALGEYDKAISTAEQALGSPQPNVISPHAFVPTAGDGCAVCGRGPNYTAHHPAPVQHLSVADFAKRLFDLHGFMLLHSAGSDGKPTITISFPDMKEAQQFHNTLVELSQHRATTEGSAE